MTQLLFLSVLTLHLPSQGIQAGRDRDMTNYTLMGNGEFGGEGIFRFDVGPSGWRSVIENTFVFRPDLAYGPAGHFADLAIGLRLSGFENTGLNPDKATLESSAAGFGTELFFWFPARFVSVSLTAVVSGSWVFTGDCHSDKLEGDCLKARNNLPLTTYSRLLDLPAAIPETISAGGRVGVAFSLWLLEARLDFQGTTIVGGNGLKYVPVAPITLVSALHLGFGSTVWRVALDFASAWVRIGINDGELGEYFTDDFRQVDTLSLGFEYRLAAHAKVLVGTTFPEYDVRRFTATFGMIFPY